MRKIDRLFEIIQMLRGQRLRTAEQMALMLGVSKRTIYRDISGLLASGINIEGEAGIGYIIRQPIELPPLKFTSVEMEAIRLGLSLAKAVADSEIGNAAIEAEVKILSAMKINQYRPATKPFLQSFAKKSKGVDSLISMFRRAIREQIITEIEYKEPYGKISLRKIRPLGIEFWGNTWTITAWCQMRRDFRVFRLDRINKATETADLFALENGKTYSDFLELQRQRERK